MILAATGHRPERANIHGMEKQDLDSYLIELATWWLDANVPVKHDAVCWIGGAEGWDLAVGEACANLGIQIGLAVPHLRWWENFSKIDKMRADALWRRQVHGWPPTNKRLFVAESPTNTRGLNFIRDRYMVDQADKIIALYDEQPTGGTAYTVGYARKQHKPVVNLWPQWAAKGKWWLPQEGDNDDC